MMGHYATTSPTETSLAPRVYVMPCGRTTPAGRAGRCRAPGRTGPGTDGAPSRGCAHARSAVIDRLEAHGIRFFKTERDQTFKGERFVIEHPRWPSASTRARTRCAR